MHDIKSWSEIAVEQVKGRNTLTTEISRAPLRVLPISKVEACCMVMLSNYGGGIVQNDHIGLRIEAHPNTKMLITSQANNKAYHSSTNRKALQYIRGNLHTNALLVWFPDPLIPQKMSALQQVHEWNMSKDSILVIGEWFHAGRIENEESFAFQQLSSEISIRIDHKLTLLDRLQIDPQNINTASPGEYRHYKTSMNFYFGGHIDNPSFEKLTSALEGLIADITSNQSVSTIEKCRVSLSKTKSGCFVLKMAGENRIAMQPIVDRIAALLAEPEWLGVDWLKRKY